MPAIHGRMIAIAAAAAALVGFAVPMVLDYGTPALTAMGSIVNGWLPPELPPSPADEPAPPSSSPAAVASPSVPTPSTSTPYYGVPAFNCTVVDLGNGTMDADVSGPIGWSGTLLVEYTDGTPGHTFNSATYAVNLATGTTVWLQVPPEDIGASARPAFCGATAS